MKKSIVIIAICALCLVGACLGFFLSTTTVPNVVGESEERAAYIAKDSHLDAILTEEFSDTVPLGTVIRQGLEAGKRVGKGKSIEIVISKGPDLVLVPEVCGNTLDTARAIFERAGLTLEYTETYSDTIAKNVIISQSYEANTDLKRGSTVTLVVSAGIEPREVPDVLNKSANDAKAILEFLDFKIVIKECFSDTVEKGCVIRQSIAAGETVDKGATIELAVSMGQGTVPVPNVCGKTEKEAKQLLLAADLNVMNVRQFSDTVAEGVVISQSTSEGMIQRGSVITLYVSAGVANTIGNSNSNSCDYARVAGQGDWVYFVGSDFRLNKMRSDGSDKETLLPDHVLNLNVVGEWIYFVNMSDNDKLYKVKIDGTQKTKLTDFGVDKIHVVGDWIYYQKGFFESAIYKIKTDGTQNTRITADKCSYINVEGDWIYYTAGSDFYAYRIKTDGTQKSQLHPYFRGYHLTVEDGVAYCLPYNGDELFSTVKVDGTNHWGVPEVENVQFMCLNISNGWIYYVKFNHMANSRAFICKMNLSNLEEVELREVQVEVVNLYLNVVGDWIYFPNDADQDQMYRLKTDGSVLEKCG